MVRLLAYLPLGPASRRALDELAADWHHERRPRPEAPRRTPRPAWPAPIRTRASANLAFLTGSARVVLSSFGSFEEHPMRHLGQDIRHGLRRLIAAPVFTIFAIVSLALGIGATTAIYSVVHALVFQPIPMRDIDRVVNIYHSAPPGAAHLMALSRPDYEDLEAQQNVFAEVAAWRRLSSVIAVPGGRGQQLTGEAVSGEYFHLIGITPQAGRLIQPADDQPAAPPVAVISDGFWQAQFARDPAAVGATVRVGERPVEIVGVAPADFRGVDMPNVLPTPFWVPLSTAATLAATPWRDERDREVRMLFVKARLADGRALADAVNAVTAIAARLDATHPIGDPPHRSRQSRRPWFVSPASDFHMHESVDPQALPLSTVLLIAVGLVLLIACTNLANLVLARAAGRGHEVSVRLALGASRARLVREHLVESTLVVAAGFAVSVALARALMVWLSGGIRMAPGVTVQLAPTFNAAVGLTMAAAAILSVVVVGLVPALRATRADVRTALASGGSAAALPRWRGRRALIAAQVTVSTMLIAMAALAVQQFSATANRDMGFDIDRLAIVQMDFGVSRIPEVRARQIQERLLDRARLVPGVERAALASRLPVGGDGQWVSIETPAGETGGIARLVAATGDLFETMGVAVAPGRGFDRSATPSTAPVAVVSAQLAGQLFDGADVVGRTIGFRLQRSVADPNPVLHSVTIAGVAGDTDVSSVGSRRYGVLYLPLAQFYEDATTLVVRTTLDPAALTYALRQVAESADPSLVVMDAGPARALAGATGLAPGILASMAGLLGALALILALAGLYGVLSETISQRTREIGLRMALGADARRIARMILREGLRPVVLGLISGLMLGAVARFGLAPLFRNLLPAADPFVVAAVPLLLLAAGGVACYLPARRAARVDPNVALRDT